jgi:hypothetical protein
MGMIQSKGVFTPDEFRAALRTVFDKAGLLGLIGKAMARGSFPMDAEGDLQSWSDWLADRVEITLALKAQGEQP